jgi:hypothetical protein
MLTGFAGAEIGFLEGRDVTVEYHTADGHLERLPSLADDLVRRRVAVIFAIRRFGTGRQDGDTDHPSCLWSGRRSGRAWLGGES